MEIDFRKFYERIFITQTYEYPVVKYVKDTLNESDKAVDVGAFIGYYTLLFSRGSIFRLNLGNSGLIRDFNWSIYSLMPHTTHPVHSKHYNYIYWRG